MSYRKIDVHAHYLTPVYRKSVYENYGEKPDGVATPPWDVASQLKLMEENHIDYALLGISSPYFYPAKEDEALALTRENNREAHDMIQGHEDKLAFLAALPALSPDKCEEVIDEALDLGAKGFSLNTNMDGVYMGDPALDPLMEELNSRKALVHIHPTSPSAVPSGACKGFPIPGFEFFCDTTRAFINMSLNHTFKKFPNIRFIFSHAGAFIAFLAQRINGVCGFMEEKDRPDIYGDLSRAYFDLAGFSEKYQLEALKDVTPISHLFYGSDFPFTPPESIKATRKDLEESQKLTDEEKEMVFFENAKEAFSLEF